MFCAKTHAFIAAEYYRKLMEYFPKEGERVFIMATQRYGEQRGSRMAQRAIRDGAPLNFASYNKYSEWESVPGEEHVINLLSTTPDYSYEVLSCPWAQQFAQMGEIHMAKIYCSEIDIAISRGFNPSLDFRVPKILHRDGKCEFILKDAYIDPSEDDSKTPENIRGFDYHCAHIFFTYAETIKGIFGYEGNCVADSVKSAFKNQYGEALLNEMLKFEETNFNIVGEK